MKSKAVVNVDPFIIVVNVHVLDHQIIIDKPNVPIPWDFHGIVRWQIDGPDDAAFDPAAGVKFQVDNAPFTPYRVSAKVWEMDVRNTNNAVVSIPFKYTLNLTDGNAVIVDDPTVENDSPPKPVARRVRRPRRNARARV
ncbi:MAG TPA: hypothetical protein VEO54_32015 [Thermoanaerobaculia bacterium]|nr:hypothetical protein [Thermoanaerobaculia bacterium]